MATDFSRPPAAPARRRRVFAWVVALVGILAVVGPMFVGIYTDWLWFGEVHYRGVFNKVIVAKLGLMAGTFLITAGIIYLVGRVTWRNRPKDLDIDPDSPLYQYRQMMDRSVKALLFIVPVATGIFAAVMSQSYWRTVLLFFNRQSFGVTDAQFGKDLGFFAFVLPMAQVVVGALAFILGFSFLFALVLHYLLGSIRVGNKMLGQRGMIAKNARVQLAAMAGLWMLVSVARYWFGRYALLDTKHDIFTGGSYTDINAYLPARIILMIIAAFVAAAFFSAIVLKDLRIPVLAAVLMLLSSVVIGAGWPIAMESFWVKPNRAVKEAEYINRNIEATRYAYGLTDDKVTYEDNWGVGSADDDKVSAEDATISNIRLLDPEVLSPTFTQMQQLRNFYGFPDALSVDRYKVDGQLRDYVVAARELDPNGLRDNQRDWINRHTVYTHGNGFVAAQANQVDEVARDAGSTRGGFPVYTVSDLQTNAKNASSEEKKDAEELGIVVDQPRIYFGPVIASAKDNADYAIVGDSGSGPVEYDTENTTYTYTGTGGVDVGNIFNRAAFALKYQEMNMILSDRVGADSKIIFDRDPRKRVEKVAPWLTTDSKTYPTVIDGRVKWIVDGYTTLRSLPYAQRTSLQQATEDALNPAGTTQRLITDEVSYIRNSVKATVDAYDGTVELYEFDTQDPVLKAWEGVFPGTVKPESEISPELREHLRYPEDLFKVQRSLLTRYHVDDPRAFFTNDAFWSVPGDPTKAETNQLAQPPYYVVAADPKTKKPSFQLITPFRGLQREFLAAHMSVSSDPDNYGKITVRVLPTNTQTQGPKQAQDALMSSDQVARDRTLWEGTNDLRNGNLLTLPVGGGEILYVEPIYSQRKNQESAFPKLLRVLVSYKGKVGYAPTISEALAQVGIDPKAAQEIDVIQGDGDTKPKKDKDDKKSEETSEGSAPSAPATGAPGDEAEAISRINDALDGLDRAKGGSFEEYGKALDKLDRAVEDYRNLKH